MSNLYFVVLGSAGYSFFTQDFNRVALLTTFMIVGFVMDKFTGNIGE